MVRTHSFGHSNKRNEHDISPKGYVAKMSLNPALGWGVSTQIDFSLKCQKRDSGGEQPSKREISSSGWQGRVELPVAFQWACGDSKKNA
jgi:hypothetical protein